jgi:hypothetical protein
MGIGSTMELRHKRRKGSERSHLQHKDKKKDGEKESLFMKNETLATHR